MRPSDVAEKVLLRLPEGMKAELAARARANRRSMNSEIIVYLERMLTERPRNYPTTQGAPT